MKAVFALIGWLVLAGIGFAWAGIWGFLGAAAVCVLYYALLRPIVRRREDSRRDATALRVADLSNYVTRPKAIPQPMGEPRQ
jgi:hypothetical protein